MQEKLKNVWRIESTLIITFQVTEENEADQTALEENYPSIGDPKEIGQTHNMFSRIFRIRICDFILPNSMYFSQMLKTEKWYFVTKIVLTYC